MELLDCGQGSDTERRIHFSEERTERSLPVFRTSRGITFEFTGLRGFIAQRPC